MVTNVAFATASRGRGLRAKNPKPSHYGLLLGLPCQMVMVGGAGWWRGILVEVVAVAGTAFAFANARGKGGFGAKNPKLSTRAWFRAVSVQMLLKWIAAWIQQPIA